MEIKALWGPDPVVDRSGGHTDPSRRFKDRCKCCRVRHRSEEVVAGASLSPLSCGCVLAMIHRTKQHFIRAFREKRGFCHFTESFALPGGGSTPFASPSSPSTTLPSTWRGCDLKRKMISLSYEVQTSKELLRQKFRFVIITVHSLAILTQIKLD